MIKKPICWIPVAVSYALLAWFVYSVINPLCYNIFQQPAFVLTTDYFWSTVNEVGGLSEYLQMFIDQFTMFRLVGTLFLVAELLAAAFLIARYVRKFTGDNPYVAMLAYILPVAISVVAWSDIKYAFAINMQILLLAAVLNLQQALTKYNWHKIVAPLLAVAVYHACGAVALYTYTICVIIQFALNADKRDLFSLIGTIAVAVLWPLIVYKLIMPIKPEGAFYDIRPQKLMFVSFKNTIVPYWYFISLPALVAIGYAYNRIQIEKKAILISVSAVVLIAAGTVFFQHQHDNPIERAGFKMEVAAYQKDWNWILRYMKNNKQLSEKSNYDRFVNFYYDMALAQNNQLPEKIFYYPQLLGNQGLFLDKPMATNIGYPVSMFYYNLGLVTSALHFAFEAQSTYTESHYVMRMVIDCLIIIGDYQTAEKFIEKYEHVMFSGKFVADRRNFMVGDQDTDLDRDFVNNVRKQHPKGDFYMQSRQNNMAEVFLANTNNRVASQYLLCSALLQCDFDLFANLLINGYYSVDNNNLPRSFQEALLLYRAISNNVKPGIENYQIQPYIESKFNDFKRLVNAKPDNIEELVKKNFPNTFWTYYFIDSPLVTGWSLD